MNTTTTARVISVQDGMVTIEVPDGGPPLMKNEVVYVCPQRRTAGHEERLKGEILRVRGRTADAQVFESTQGVGIGDPVEQTGRQLSVELGPGLLGQIFDGLQNPLPLLAERFGNFLPRGVELDALPRNRRWPFQAVARLGDRVRAGDTLGTVQEGFVCHKILAPFDLAGSAELTWIQQGNVTVDEPIARLATADGDERNVEMVKVWPVRRALPTPMLRERRCERVYPSEPMITTLRLVDTFFPIAKGGTGCIPGPFGAGKTVLQGLISRYSDVDVVVVVACGERAGEVVETIADFPQMHDPRTGGSLMERTIIICNTSSMPVAAREASIYTGVTLGEYYRQMGLDVLLIADSTSRWAQAMRETSGRLEEIPGEEAFPAYLDSAIRGIYERAGLLRLADGSHGSLTMIGTVSPAGGNFEEPVTQSTLSTVKTFLGLSSERAYKRFYPAVDPLLSWSRYLGQLERWYETQLSPGWVESVRRMRALLQRGDGVQQMMQVTGEEGVTIDDFVVSLQAQMVDLVYLQQDAFDDVDVSVPLPRQKQLFELLHRLTTRGYRFADKAAARDYFTKLTGLFRNFNYTSADSPEYANLLRRIEEFAAAVPEV